jgi:hypothetical protein
LFPEKLHKVFAPLVRRVFPINRHSQMPGHPLPVHEHDAGNELPEVVDLHAFDDVRFDPVGFRQFDKLGPLDFGEPLAAEGPAIRVMNDRCRSRLGRACYDPSGPFKARQKVLVVDMADRRSGKFT